MPRPPTSSSVRQATRAGAAAIALMVLTTVHHVYGGLVYATPWRHHVAIPAGLTTLVIVGALAVLRRQPGTRAGRVALWTFVAATAVFPVALIGLFEGGYNHVLKNVLFFGGASDALMRALFPAPAYEMPNDLLFEATGVLQFVLGAATTLRLYPLVRGTVLAAGGGPGVSDRPRESYPS